METSSCLLLSLLLGSKQWEKFTEGRWVLSNEATGGEDGMVPCKETISLTTGDNRKHSVPLHDPDRRPIWPTFLCVRITVIHYQRLASFRHVLAVWGDLGWRNTWITPKPPFSPHPTLSAAERGGRFKILERQSTSLRDIHSFLVHDKDLTHFYRHRQCASPCSLHTALWSQRQTSAS